MNSSTELVAVYSGIDLSVKNICNAAFDCDQNSFRSLTMMPISMKNAVWKGSLVGFGTESLCPQKVVGRGKQSIWENITLTQWTVWRPGRGSGNITTEEEMRKLNYILSVLLVLQSPYSDILRESIPLLDRWAAEMCPSLRNDLELQNMRFAATELPWVFPLTLQGSAWRLLSIHVITF